jgi:phosphatidylinositol-3-phosphatase
VFLIMMSNQGYDQAFGTTAGHPYLASTLRKQGELLQDYYGVAPSPLANEIALLSGQGPTQDTATDCPVFTSLASTGNQGQQVLGNGCVYPATTVTLPDELTDNGNTWKAYIQGIDQGPAGTPKTCRRPDVGQPDPNQAVSPTDPYVTWTNPFVYFGSLTTGNACASDDIGLPQLAEDLKRARTTPNLAYIAPDPCDDGNDTPCMPGSPAGLGQADTFLKSVVPEIEASPAYKQDGMIVITFDQAPQSGPGADTSSCCDQPTFPNLSGAGATTTTGTTTTPATTTGATTSGTTNAATTTGTPTTTPTAPIPAGTTTTAAATTPATAPATTTTPTSCTTTTTTTTGTTSTGTTTTGTTTAGTTTGATTTGTTPSTSTTSSSTTPGVSTTPTTGTTTTTGTSTSPGCNSSGTPAGGGQVGALVISQYVKANTSDLTDTFNHFSLLKTIEGLFSIKELGYSKDASLPEFDASVFNDYTAG